MTTALAGPYELYSTTDKVSLCLMDDFTVSKRKYDNNGKVLNTTSVKAAKDLETGVKALEGYIAKLLGKQYSLDKASAATNLGKRTA